MIIITSGEIDPFLKDLNFFSAMCAFSTHWQSEVCPHEQVRQVGMNNASLTSKYFRIKFRHHHLHMFRLNIQYLKATKTEEMERRFFPSNQPEIEGAALSHNSPPDWHVNLLGIMKIYSVVQRLIGATPGLWAKKRRRQFLSARWWSYWAHPSRAFIII